MTAIYLIATLDTKGREAAFLREQLTALGCAVTVVDAGCAEPPHFAPDISREEVFAAADADYIAVLNKRDRGAAVTLAARGASVLLAAHHAQSKVAGVIAIGGSAGTTIGTAAMRALPVGVPKLMVSTLASGQVRHYVGDKDVLMLNSIVDISGLNRITSTILSNAARAMAGMTTFKPASSASTEPQRPIIAATMFGVTTPCIEHARAILEQAGYEVLVFHATGAGGQAMESLIADGLIAGVLDITTTELADELVGGFLTAGPDRLTAAGKRGIPQVISVGATDMVNFHAPETIPAQFKGRTFYHHNPTVTLMRTTAEENRRIGSEIGRKASQARGPVAILLPQHGISAIDKTGAPFDDPQARESLFESIRDSAGATEIVELDRHINDAEFAEAAARKLIALMTSPAGAGR